MWDFLKGVIFNKNKDVTFIVLDDSNPDVTESYKLNPKHLIYLTVSLFMVLIIITGAILYITPLGNSFFYRENTELRKKAVEISRQVQDLQDSLRLRDQQFKNIKKVISNRIDTSFNVSMGDMQNVDENISANETPKESGGSSSFIKMISGNDIIRSQSLFEGPEFPAAYPLEGLLTREFNPTAKHYGIDIAGSDGDLFHSVASGIIISSEWTINFGYVLNIQHNNGYMSIYKHSSDLFKEKGDIISKGELLGRIGDRGTISSGPHLHFELWKDGTALDPTLFLSKY